MKKYIAAAILMGTSLWISPANADSCTWHGSFRFGSNGTGSATVKSGQSCTFAIRVGGMVKSLKISSPAKNGSAQAINLSTIAYKPKASFKGQDSFVFAIDGASQKGVAGVSNVTMTITVQ
jgi:hypothetical protein